MLSAGGQWIFNQTSGTTVTDSSGNNNTATLVNSPTWATGNTGSNGALSFNGSTQYLQASDSASLDPTSQITVGAWVNAAAWSGNNRILQKADSGQDDQYRLLAQSGVLEFDLHNVGTVTAPLPSVGVWHYVAGTYNGAVMDLYVDGQLVGSTSATASIPVTSGPLDIGTKPGSTTATDHFNGLLDQVEVDNNALTQAQIDQKAGLLGQQLQRLLLDQRLGLDADWHSPDDHHGGLGAGRAGPDFQDQCRGDDLVREQRHTLLTHSGHGRGGRSIAGDRDQRGAQCAGRGPRGGIEPDLYLVHHGHAAGSGDLLGQRHQCGPECDGHLHQGRHL